MQIIGKERIEQAIKKAREKNRPQLLYGFSEYGSNKAVYVYIDGNGEKIIETGGDTWAGIT